MYIVMFSSLLKSYSLLGALRGWGVGTMCGFWGFFPAAGPGRVLYMSAQSMVSGISVPAVAFPVQDMQQAGECWQVGGSVCWLLHGTFRALERAGSVQAPVSVSSACGRHKWSGSTGLLWAWIEFLALPRLFPLLCQPGVFLCFHGPAAKLRRGCSSVFCLSQAAALRVLQGLLHRRHNELFCWQEPLGAAAVQPSKTDRGRNANLP